MQVEKSILKNGIKILNIHIPDSLSSTIMIYVKAGSRYETEKENGIAHFMEHTLLNGSPKYPNPQIVAKEIEMLGGYCNAFTDREMVAYYIKCPNENFSKAFDILSDLFLHPTFEENDIEKERGIILEEYQRREDHYEIKCYENFLNGLFNNDRLGQRVLGTVENINRFTKEEILNYKDKHYRGENIVVSIAGDLDKNEIEDKVKIFEEIKPVDKSYFVKSEGKTQKDRNIELKEVNQTHIVYGTYGLPDNDERMSQLKVGSFALGTGSGSALFQRIREQLGLCYTIHSYYWGAKERGIVGIQTGINGDNFDQCIEEIDKILEKFKKEKLDENDIIRAKQVYKSLYLDYNNSYEMASFLGEDELLNGQYKLVSDYIKEVESVTADQVLDIMNELWSQPIYLSVITNKENIK